MAGRTSPPPILQLNLIVKALSLESNRARAVFQDLLFDRSFQSPGKRSKTNSGIDIGATETAESSVFQRLGQTFN